MMVIVRAAPDAGGTKPIHAKHSHQLLGQRGSAQNGVVLLVMVNDKKTQEKEARENTAPQCCPPGTGQDCAAEAEDEAQEGGEDMPPAPGT